eukprot:4368410-Ditylum_brightwellii.AAC.1
MGNPHPLDGSVSRRLNIFSQLAEQLSDETNPACYAVSGEIESPCPFKAMPTRGGNISVMA